jgi:uroporphyrinogen-III synthase
MVLSIGPLTSKELIKYNIPFIEATDHSLEGIYQKLYINE